MIKWFKNLFSSGKVVEADNGSVAIGGSNYGIIKINNGGVARTVDLGDLLSEQPFKQLEIEKNSAKYIPDVFIETRDTKDLARIFAHPCLFVPLAYERFYRAGFDTKNSALFDCGMPEVNIPSIADNVSDLDDIVGVAEKFIQEARAATDEVSVYESLSASSPPPHPIRLGYEHFYEERVYNLSSLQFWIKRDMESRIKDFEAAKSDLFILTGKAGQGKTNFICDFIENFIIPHAIPCLYFSGQKFNGFDQSNLEQSISYSLFQDGDVDFYDVLRCAGAIAKEKGTPFLFVIDGINEHHDITGFTKKLEVLLENILEIANVKVLITCRSEFFENRFGNLLQSSFADRTFVQAEAGERIEDDQYDQILEAYFEYFGINRKHLSKNSINVLRKDLILLRFFCEAYGARGKPDGYKQPEFNHIYQEDVFRKYLEEKLGAADIFLRSFAGTTPITVSNEELKSVLRSILAYMLNNQAFSNVPMSVIPEKLRDALYALLDQELILRKDLSDEKAALGDEFYLNFTFDEFRDFLFAQYLCDIIFKTDKPTFDNFIEKLAPELQISEGVKKFLFYASRQESRLDFWEQYQHSQMYKDVYPHAIFNIDKELYREEDVTAINEALLKKDYIARDVARALATSWCKERDGLLYIGVLLTFIKENSNEYYDFLVVKGFSPSKWDHVPASSEAFKKFILNLLQDDYDFEKEEDGVNLLILMGLFMPINSLLNLESPAVATLRAVGQKYPKAVTAALKELLDYNIEQLHPFIWRLLAYFKRQIDDLDSLLTLAQSELEGEVTVDNREKIIEVKRFIEKEAS